LATGRYAQTVLPAFIRRVVTIPYEREIVKLEDGGTVAIDWIRTEDRPQTEKQSSLVIILCPGLTGTSKSRYIQQSVLHLMDQMQKSYPNTRISIGVFIYRGNAGLPLTSPKAYNGANTDDMKTVMELVSQQEHPTAMFAVGYSLGANLLTKYLGENGTSCPLSAAISISNPLNFTKACPYWTGWRFQTLLGSHLTRFLKESLLPHMQHYEAAGFCVDRDSIMTSKTIQDFDERFTIRVGGWDNIEAYYSTASSEAYLPRVQIPMLFMSADDDPLCPGHIINREAFRSNPKLTLLLFPKGGHIGWCRAGDPRGAAHTDLIATEFLQTVIQNKLDGIC